MRFTHSSPNCPFFGQFEIDFQLRTVLYFSVIATIFRAYISVVSSIYSLGVDVLYLVYVAHLGELRGDAAEIYT